MFLCHPEHPTVQLVLYPAGSSNGASPPYAVGPLSFNRDGGLFCATRRQLPVNGPSGDLKKISEPLFFQPFRTNVTIEIREYRQGGTLFSLASPKILMPSIGVFTWDVTQNKLIGDEVFAAVYGLPEKHAASGLPIEEVIGRIFENDRERVARGTHASIIDGRFATISYRVMTAGKLRTVSAYGRCLFDEDGLPSYFSGAVGRDMCFGFASNDV